jgi:hypothetical protein
MSVKSGVNTTPHSVMSNPEVQHQWYRARFVGYISCQLNVSTMLTDQRCEEEERKKKEEKI